MRMSAAIAAVMLAARTPAATIKLFAMFSPLQSIKAIVSDELQGTSRKKRGCSISIPPILQKVLACDVFAALRQF
jgi:hypothetical protein